MLYGTLNLWLTKTKSVDAGQSLCSVYLCQPLNVDLPTTIDEAPDKPLAIAESALQIDPSSAYRWADLADTEIDARNIDGGRFCIHRALALAPGNPAILFRSANFFLRIQDYPETIQRLFAVLRNPDLAAYYDRVFRLYSQMDVPLADLLNEGIPRSPDAANSFLRFWVGSRQVR